MGERLIPLELSMGCKGNPVGLYQLMLQIKSDLLYK